MNQILNSKEIKATDNYIYSSSPDKKFNFYKLIFFLCILFTIIFFIFFFTFLINIKSKENHAKDLANTFTLTSLYSNNSNYSTRFFNDDVEEDDTEPFIIGVIKIDKIKIDYPIISSTSDELLTIAPCRFAGPMANEVGNLCIAGHNYIDNTFFAKIKNLQQGDEINIYDLSGNMVSYNVTNMFEIENNDFSCTTQETNGEKWVTLMTCNSIKGTRFIVRCVEK